MAEPIFLGIDRVLRLHRSLIEHYGGIEGIRDTQLLHSAVLQPEATFGGTFLSIRDGCRFPPPVETDGRPPVG